MNNHCTTSKSPTLLLGLCFAPSLLSSLFSLYVSLSLSLCHWLSLCLCLSLLPFLPLWLSVAGALSFSLSLALSWISKAKNNNKCLGKAEKGWKSMVAGMDIIPKSRQEFLRAVYAGTVLEVELDCGNLQSHLLRHCTMTHGCCPTALNDLRSGIIFFLRRTFHGAHQSEQLFAWHLRLAQRKKTF